jgi:electron transfer flavoprotein beta subunit
MDAIVCIKQVPNVTEVTWDPETGSLIRKGIPSIINPGDRHALEAALQLREKVKGTITVLSMGPSQVEEALREALAMGADRAVQLTDKAFAGSDTWATSYTLGLAIRKIGGFDLVLCGKEALDGMTAQVGPELAEVLGIPQLTYATSIEVNGDKVRVRQALEDIERVLETTMPALITVERIINEPRVVPMDGIIEAYAKEIEVWQAEDLLGEKDHFGLHGSPTRLKKIFTPKLLRVDVEIFTGTPEETARGLIAKLRERHIL